VGTIKSHTGNVYRKFGAGNRAKALALARDLESRILAAPGCRSEAAR